MSELVKRRPELFRLFFLANMLVGLLVFVIAVYLTITGQYDSLAHRQQSETLLNAMAVGSLLYMIGFWYLDVFTKPYLVAAEKSNK